MTRVGAHSWWLAVATGLLVVCSSAGLLGPVRTMPPDVAAPLASVEGSASFGVATFNLRHTRTRTRAGRAQLRADVLRLAVTTDADVIGFQEAAGSLRALKAELPAVGWEVSAPAGIEDPIAWRSSVFSLETDVLRPAMVWRMSRRSAHRRHDRFPARYLTRVLLRHGPSGRTVAVFNTHVNQSIERRGRPLHNENWRKANAHLARLGARVAESRADVTVVTGDFNVDAVHDARVADPRLPFRRYAALMQSNYRLLGIPKGYTARGTRRHGPRRIDYVFLENGNLAGAVMTSQEVLTAYRRERNASDHAPVLVRFSVAVAPLGPAGQPASRGRPTSSSL